MADRMITSFKIVKFNNMTNFEKAVNRSLELIQSADGDILNVTYQMYGEQSMFTAALLFQVPMASLPGVASALRGVKDEVIG